MKRRRDDLSFSLNFDVERLDPGGENSGEAFAGETVEEVETRLREAVEAAPPLDDSNTGLLHARAHHTAGVPHDRKKAIFNGELKLRKKNLDSIWCVNGFVKDTAISL